MRAWGTQRAGAPRRRAHVARGACCARRRRAAPSGRTMTPTEQCHLGAVRPCEPEAGEPGSIKWDDVRPWPRLDEAALRGLAGDVVRLLDPHTEADAAAMLVTFLVLFGNAVGPGPHARVGAVQHPA